jgi:putative membrane protein
MGRRKTPAAVPSDRGSGTMAVKQRLWQAFISPAYPVWLLGVFVLWFGVWAIRPPHPRDFVLEHLFTVAFVALLCWSHARFRLSNLSYTMIFIFLCTHVVGAHYTYSEVPYEEWFRRLGSWVWVQDFSVQSLFGFTRNHYDRLVHFLFGLLMAYPVREVFIRIVGVRGFWGYYLPLDVMMSFSMVYELIEWGVAMTAGDVGESYLGSQGDVWDAQKDMALATLGGLIAMATTALVNWRYGRDFAAEMAFSPQPQGSAPLGEVRIAEMLGDQLPAQVKPQKASQARGKAKRKPSKRR